MSVPRREVLRLGGTVGVSSLAGCTNVPTLGGSRLNLTLLNFDDHEHRLRVRLLRPDRATEDAAVVYDRDYLLPARASGGSPGEVTKASIAPNRNYLIRASISGNTGEASRHHHYYPPDTGSSGDGPTLFAEIHSGDNGTPRLELF